MHNNHDVIRSVREQLHWDASVDDARIGVAVSGDTIVLSGNVPEYLDRQHAEIAALAVAGTLNVDNRLVISYPDEPAADADRALAARVRTSLSSDPATASEKITVDVRNGAVILSGFADAHRKKLRAAELAADIRGVVAVRNGICLVPAGNSLDETLARRVSGALAENADGIDPDAIDIEAENGRITLYGVVATNGARLEAEKAAYEAAGAPVDNRLIVR